MPGVASLLDSSHARTVVELRRRLNDELGVRTPRQNHDPHFSYQVADRYDEDRLVHAVQQLSKQQGPFTVRTNGIGVFTDSEPLVVYIPLVRTDQLTRFHRNVWDRTKRVGSGFQTYYRPDHWTPHVTIAPIERDALGDVVDLLGEYSFRWEFEVDSIAVIRGDPPNRRVEHRMPLGGGAASR